MSTYVWANELFTMAGSALPKMSVIIVLATLRIPIPAVTLKQSTIHSK